MASVVEALARQAQLTFSKTVTDEAFSDCFSKLVRCIRHLNAKDVTLSRDVVLSENSNNSATSRAPVTYIEVTENEDFSMGIFVLRSGARIPLHDHPGMHGVLKVIQGSVRITSFSALPRVPDLKLPRDISRRVRHSEKELLIPVEKHTAADVTDSDEPCVLCPTKGNYHEIRAVGGSAAFLDILAPPYDMKERDCHYYLSFETACPDSDVKTWLLKSPPPSDFWCDSAPYYGPAVEL